MGQLLLTVLLIAGAWIAYRAVAGKGTERRDRVAEAAKRATMSRSGEPVDLGSLKRGKNGVYEPEKGDREK